MVSRVLLSTNVYFSCLAHAQMSEKEEIMGLLLGNTMQTSSGLECAIWASCIFPRSVREAERVEIAPEHLAAASTRADEVTEQMKRPTRVVGWYHSHPHLSSVPSHVDVRTQGQYQALDPGFLGLIFSVHNQDAQTMGMQMQVTAFQSLDVSEPGEPGGSRWQRVDVPLELMPPPPAAQPLLSGTAVLASALLSEECALYERVRTATDTSDPLQQSVCGAVAIESTGRLLLQVTAPVLRAATRTAMAAVHCTADAAAACRRSSQ